MAKAIQGELTGGGISSMVAMLEQEANDTQNLYSAVNGFIEGTKATLTGPAYDAAREKMVLYLQDIKSRQATAAALASAISQGASSLASYMGEYAVLDDKDIPEIEAQIKNLEKQIESARQTISALRSSSNEKEKESIGHYEQQISAWEATKKELEKKLERLKGLAGADSAAFGSTASASSQVAQLTASVAGIKVSKIPTATLL